MGLRLVETGLINECRVRADRWVNAVQDGGLVAMVEFEVGGKL